MSSLQLPMPVATGDANLITNQIITSLGTNALAMPFPQFSGDNPNQWKTLPEQYFHMFATHTSYWIPISIVHFTGPAGIWLQSV
jgi:hypothetical protein